MPNEQLHAKAPKPAAPKRRKPKRNVILATKDSGTMASSFTDALILQRQIDGRLVLTMSRSGADAIPEEESDAEAFAELYYEADVEGAEWLLEFIMDPPSSVADRVSLADVNEVLKQVVRCGSAPRR